MNAVVYLVRPAEAQSNGENHHHRGSNLVSEEEQYFFCRLEISGEREKEGYAECNIDVY
ncbi:MAG: hypothetical protein SCK29_06835 [Bacillota bacterium]|nr:hypothetical protein [Bacillota bacterium]